jgi:hypothetical protein
MVWDGESEGTLNHVINVICQEEPVVVYRLVLRAKTSAMTGDEMSSV